jgi:hypothetical protein
MCVSGREVWAGCWFGSGTYVHQCLSSFWHSYIGNDAGAIDSVRLPLLTASCQIVCVPGASQDAGAQAAQLFDNSLADALGTPRNDGRRFRR